MSRKKFEDKTNIRERLKAAREARNMTHDALGVVLKVSGPHLASIETGKANPGAHLADVIEHWIAREYSGSVSESLDLATQEAPAYMEEETDQMLEEVREIMSSRNKVIIDALRANLKAFTLILRSLPAGGEEDT